MMEERADLGWSFVVARMQSMSRCDCATTKRRYTPILENLIYLRVLLLTRCILPPPIPVPSISKR
jgi:hypothetical protein